MKKTFKTLCMFLFIITIGVINGGSAGAQNVPASIARPSDTDYVDSIPKVQDLVKQKWADQTPEWQNYSGKSTEKNKENKTSTSEQPKGSATSGNVAYSGAKSLGNDFGLGGCGSGNIFDQLGCRAGVIGRGLQSTGYIIAGFGLLAFSLAALFGKVKWNVFVTIMFSCFVLSMMVFVINTFTREGNSAWIAGIHKTDPGNNASVPGDTDKVKVSQSQ